jgi:hypothetical protein
MVDPKMTMFKAMSLDEQVETIKQSAQEALRAREEIRVTEETKFSLVTLVQNKGFYLTPEGPSRGLLLIEKAQRVIDQLENDLDLVEMTRVPVDNPVERRIGPSGPVPIQIEDITGLDSPEFSAP